MKLKQRVRQPIASPQLSHQRQLATLFLALALALGLALHAVPLLAQQPEGKDGAEAAPAAPKEPAAAKPAATPAPTASSAPAPKSTGNSSPFDYRSSEEISEDVPVSFPVDI
ncbi:MAG: hypothetical protein IPG64_00585 [Haliea sp.]|nr:hypothetical protein [Haliea sp.]